MENRSERRAQKPSVGHVGLRGAYIFLGMTLFFMSLFGWNAYSESKHLAAPNLIAQGIVAEIDSPVLDLGRVELVLRELSRGDAPTQIKLRKDALVKASPGHTTLEEKFFLGKRATVQWIQAGGEKRVRKLSIAEKTVYELAPAKEREKLERGLRFVRGFVPLSVAFLLSIGLVLLVRRHRHVAPTEKGIALGMALSLWLFIFGLVAGIQHSSTQVSTVPSFLEQIGPWAPVAGAILLGICLAPVVVAAYSFTRLNQTDSGVMAIPVVGHVMGIAFALFRDDGRRRQWALALVGSLALLSLLLFGDFRII